MYKTKVVWYNNKKNKNKFSVEEKERSIMANVNFEVIKIEKAMKPGCVVVTLKFKDSDKEYTYVRRAYGNITVIDGCKICFNKENYQVEKVERIYETKGVKKLSTENSVGTISTKIKNEIENKSIEIPKVQIPEVKDEVRHDKYDEIKCCLECGIPVYLAGPAGSGKNHTVEQIAKELGWNFYFSNSVQQEYKLTGFIDAGGNFHETEFSKACKEAAKGNDVVFFLDEIDASIPEVLVLLNAAIANGYFEFPDGKVNFGDKVHFVAAGNTVGNGADDMYTGRMVLDQATLDRFAIIEFDYCLKIEMAITNNNTELVEFIHQMREEAKSKGIRATFSYRCMIMITKLEAKGMNLETAIKISVVKGLDKDTINTFNPFGNTKYHNALRKIQMAA